MRSKNEQLDDIEELVIKRLYMTAMLRLIALLRQIIAEP